MIIYSDCECKPDQNEKKTPIVRGRVSCINLSSRQLPDEAINSYSKAITDRARFSHGVKI